MSNANELHREFLSVLGLNSFVGNVSSPRSQMFSSHIGQRLVINGSTEKFIQSGMEQEFGKYTFSVKMPADGNIIKIVEKYPSGDDVSSIKQNPLTTIIFENLKTNEIDILDIPYYCSYHQYFGFKYESQSGLNKLKPKAFIPEGTMFADTPAKTPEGGYKYGIELNLCLASIPGVAEDGIIVSRDVLDRLSFNTFESRIAEWGSKRFPLNLYGNKDNYKPFPEIGDRVRDDGLLVMFRDYDRATAAADFSIYDIMEPDYIYDKGIYVIGGGTIVDIRVLCNEGVTNSSFEGMDTQINKYVNATRKYHQTILFEYFRLRKERGGSLRISPALHRLVTESIALLDDSKVQRIGLKYKQVPLDTYRVEFIVEQTIKPNIGFKLCGIYGNKGVICKIEEPENMPVAQNGVRADIIMDGNSVVNRMNPGVVMEQYLNTASYDINERLKKLANYNTKGKRPIVQVTELFNNNIDLFNSVYNKLMEYYSLVSIKMFNKLSKLENEGKIEHLASCFEKGIYLYIPTDYEEEFHKVTKALENDPIFKPTYGPVTYIGNSGIKCTTKYPIRIGSAYMLLLEKIADDGSAVSSGKLQTHGLLAKLSKLDKNAQPIKNQAVRAIGETEGRIIISYVGERATAEIMDRNNNPFSHKQVVYNIISADKPTNIDSLINRETNPFGKTKPLELVKHIAQCAGYKYSYIKTV